MAQVGKAIEVAQEMAKKLFCGDLQKTICKELMNAMEAPIDRATIQAIAQLIVERFDPEQVILFDSHYLSHSGEQLLVVLRADAGRPQLPWAIRSGSARRCDHPLSGSLRQPSPYSLIHKALEEGEVLYERRVAQRSESTRERLSDRSFRFVHDLVYLTQLCTAREPAFEELIWNSGRALQKSPMQMPGTAPARQSDPSRIAERFVLGGIRPIDVISFCPRGLAAARRRPRRARRSRPRCAMTRIPWRSGTGGAAAGIEGEVLYERRDGLNGTGSRKADQARSEL